MSTSANAPLFLATFLRHPLRIGSVAPSSPSLGRHIAAAMIDSFASSPGMSAPALEDALIVELGAGTGAITRELVGAGIRPSNLAVNELDPILFEYLHKEFDQAVMIGGDASTVSHRIPPAWVGRVTAVVSSLPLRNFSDGMKTRLVEDIFRMLRPGGAMVQYTYPLASPLAVDRFGLTGELYKRVWFNVPPAAIWRFRKRRLDHKA